MWVVCCVLCIGEFCLVSMACIVTGNRSQSLDLPDTHTRYIPAWTRDRMLKGTSDSPPVDSQ